MSSYHGNQTIKKTKIGKSGRKPKQSAPDRRKDSNLDQYFESVGFLAWLLQCTAVPGTQPIQALLNIITGRPAAVTDTDLGQWDTNAHHSRRLQFLARVTAACRQCALDTTPQSLTSVVWSQQYLQALLPSALGTHKTRMPHSVCDFAWKYMVKWCGDAAEDAVSSGLARTFVTRARELDQCCRDTTLFLVTTPDASAKLRTEKKMNFRILRVRLNACDDSNTCGEQAPTERERQMAITSRAICQV